MNRMNDSSKLVFYARIGLILHAIVLTLFILHLGQVLFIPLFFALLIAILLYPMSLFFERHHLKKNIAAILSVIIFIAFVGAIIYFFTVELTHFFKDMPKVQSKVLQLIQNTQDWLANKYNIDNDQQKAYINKSANGVLGSLMNSIGTTFLNTIEFVVLFIFFLIFTFFILLHRRLLKQFILAFFSDDRQQQKVNDIISTTRSVINSYVLGLLTEMAILFILIFIVLIILGIKYALLMAVIAAVINIIPYLGIYTAAAISMLITLANGTSNQAIEVAVVFIIVHFLDANIIMPNIVGGRVKINPLITIVAVITGKLIWGIPGMFLFIPLTGIIRIISQSVQDLRPWAILIGEEKSDYSKP
jgi:AI-2 transport protein TqsA